MREQFNSNSHLREKTDASLASSYPEQIPHAALQIGMLIRPNDPYRTLHLYAESLEAAE